ncbi:ABC transporter permease [Roseomonas sp. GC11]|uniref:ABC transporter permease n=1 Tax=Roseomonas sp. GC11 TaxID=2950546 RepID=UPI00210BE02F|nr:ABC transporter permease [Roseomonas sp. GC11]MCQ4159185.1 ABC transporter permease [Roseomonas sp. GC11]
MAALLARLFGSLGVLVAVSLVLFALIHANPVSPARVVLGNDASEEDIAEFNAERGLDRPVAAQYLAWAGAALRGEFGRSLVDDTAITRTIAQTMPVTLELVLWAFLVALAVALPLGIVSALYEDRWVDHLARALATIGVSIPGFWLGLMLIAWGAVGLGWFPAGGYVSWEMGAWPHLRAMVLPALALGLYYVAIISRMTRSAMGDVMLAEHVRVSRAMGLGRGRLMVYTLRNALPPVITVAAMSFGYMFGWALIVEQVFTLPGMSRALLNAIFRRDYIMILDIVLIITAIFLLANLIADALHRLVDPRVAR